MGVQIIIDSACDMEKREADERGLIFLPLRTDIDGELFCDGVTISHEKFYRKLASCKDIPKTAAVTATILNIKPVLSVADGRLIMLGKARGYKQSNNYLNKTIHKMGGVDFTMPVMLGYSGDDDALEWGTDLDCRIYHVADHYISFQKRPIVNR